MQTKAKKTQLCCEIWVFNVEGWGIRQTSGSEIISVSAGWNRRHMDLQIVIGKAKE